MKKLKKILSLAVVLALVFSCLSAVHLSVQAEGEWSENLFTFDPTFETYDIGDAPTNAAISKDGSQTVLSIAQEDGGNKVLAFTSTQNYQAVKFLTKALVAQYAQAQGWSAVAVRYSVDLKMEDVVSNPTTNVANVLLRGVNARYARGAVDAGTDGSNRYIRFKTIKGYGTWTTVTYELIMTAEDLASNDTYELTFDGLQKTGTSYQGFVDNVSLQVKEADYTAPFGVKLTYNGAGAAKTGKTVFAASEVSNGTLAKTYTVYNISETALKVRAAFELEAGGGPSSEETLIPAGESAELTVETAVTGTGSKATINVDGTEQGLAKFLLRFDCKDEAGQTPPSGSAIVIKINNDENKLAKLAGTGVGNAYVYAEPGVQGTFAIGTITLNNGLVEVPVIIGGNPGVIGAQVKIGYNATYFTLTEVRDTGALAGANHSDDLSRNPYTLTWENDTASANQMVQNTTLATLVFSINGNVPSGDYLFTVTPTRNTINYDLEYVTFTGVDGTLSYSCAHTFEQVEVLTAPTCETAGEGLFRCSKCGAEENREIPATGHDYSIQGAVTAPTCTEQGYTVYICSHDSSHTEKRDYTAIDPTNHDYTETVVPATCTEQGYTLHVCSRDASHTYKDNYTDIDPDNHDYEETIVEPTYFSEGYTLHVCRHDPSHTYKDNYVPALDDSTAPTLKIGSAKALIGRTITVPFMIYNNPGITGLQATVQFDSSVLTLTGVEGVLLADASASYLVEDGVYALILSGSTDENGVAARLTFLVDENAQEGEITVSVTAGVGSTAEDDVQFVLKNGTLDVREYFVGDFNSDGLVNDADRVLLSRYLADWNIDTANLDFRAVDINNDTFVDAVDRAIFARYLAHWDGYDQYFE